MVEIIGRSYIKGEKPSKGTSREGCNTAAKPKFYKGPDAGGFRKLGAIWLKMHDTMHTEIEQRRGWDTCHFVECRRIL